MKKPQFINVKGKPRLVVISFEEYQELLDIKKKAELSPSKQAELSPSKQAQVLVGKGKSGVTKEEVEEVAIPVEMKHRLHEVFSPVKAWRLYRGMTQSEVAAVSGVSTATISLIENKKKQANIDTLEALARALKVPADQLRR